MSIGVERWMFNLMHIKYVVMPVLYTEYTAMERCIQIYVGFAFAQIIAARSA